MSTLSEESWLQAAMAEYMTLRDESLRAIELQQRILRFGTTALALLIATAQARANADPLFSALLFALITPAVAAISFILWLGEVERMVRAGTFISAKERTVNSLFPDMPSAIEWETTLREQRRIISAYRPIPIIFIGSSMLATLIGTIALCRDHKPLLAAIAALIGLILSVFSGAYYSHKAEDIAVLGGTTLDATLLRGLVRIALNSWNTSGLREWLLLRRSRLLSKLDH